MPTGYSCGIHDGKQTTKEYIMGCARNFGYLGRMRDDCDKEIPNMFDPDTYHKNKTNEYELELVEFAMCSDKEIQQQIDNEYQTRIDNRNKYTLSKLEIKDRYESALEDIRKWNIPSTEHKNLKDFCISQLEYSIEYDCNMNHIEIIPNKLSIFEWKFNKEKQIREDIKYHQDKYEKEVVRTNECNSWLKQLRDSLENLV